MGDTRGCPGAMAYLLSVDPGQHSGWALWALVVDSYPWDDLGWWLTHYGRYDFDCEPDDEVLAVTELLGVLLPDWRAATVVVEGQWYRPPSTASGKKRYHASPWQDVLRLAENRCAWANAARIGGASVEVVDTSWIPAMTSGAPGKDSTRRITWVCRRRWEGLRLTDDQAAAILLGEYWLTKQTRRIVRSPRPTLGFVGLPDFKASPVSAAEGECDDERYRSV